MRNKAQPIYEIDFSTQKNPNYLRKKLMNKINILQQGRYRHLELEELWRLPNKESFLIFIISITLTGSAEHFFRTEF